jgi:hypothetical protein
LANPPRTQSIALCCVIFKHIMQDRWKPLPSEKCHGFSHFLRLDGMHEALPLVALGLAIAAVAVLSQCWSPPISATIAFQSSGSAVKQHRQHRPLLLRISSWMCCMNGICKERALCPEHQQLSLADSV